jgi:phosphoglycolate phosphatase
MTPKLVLFDIDGTLLTLPGSGMLALGQACKEILGFDFEGSGIRPDGRTDPMIVTELLLQKGFSLTRWRELEPQVWELYAALFEENMGTGHLYAGVEALLQTLANDPRFRLGLLTGNLQSTARLKLAHFSIEHYFPIGAYGSDCADRCRLGRVALERARRHYRLDFVPEHTWIIGDTEHDINAARAFGARVLAVATGNYSRAYLEEFCPDVAVDDLTDSERVVHLMA